nr:acyl-CoA dehydrogenase family protein [Micromonospora sp. M42]
MLTGLRDWLRRRPAGTGTLWDRPAVRERYARCLVAVHQLDALCAPLLDAPAAVPSAVAGMLLKVSAAETVDRVAAEAVRLRGADASATAGRLSYAPRRPCSASPVEPPERCSPASPTTPTSLPAR